MEKKLAIKIDNKRQFDCLMDLFSVKGWKNYNSLESAHKGMYPITIELNDNYQVHFNEQGYNVLSFSQFNQLSGFMNENEAVIMQNRFALTVSKSGCQIRVQDGDNGVWTVSSEPGYSITINPKTIEQIYELYKSFQ